MPSAERHAIHTQKEVRKAIVAPWRRLSDVLGLARQGSRAMKMFSIGLVGLLTLMAGSAHAAMRCGTGLIDVGDKIGKVQEKCGMPVAQESQGPTTQYGSVRITVWVYGPDGGGYRYLRFVDANLVQIEMRREAPTGRLLPWK